MVGILYVPLKLLILKSNLTPVQGLLTKVEKSYTRIPFYRFHLSNDPTLFYNSGTGFLSNLKNDKEILYKGMNKEITFFVNKKDISKTKKETDIQYIGLQKKNVLIDLYYYFFSGFWDVVFSILCILMMGLNLYALYTFKIKLFQIFTFIYLFYGILILLL